jgi:hypothetical protein
MGGIMTDSRHSGGARARSHWLDAPANVTKLYHGVWGAGLLLVAVDFVLHRHDDLAFAEMIGFYALYGFAACVSLVLAAKLLRRCVKRPEDYYDR